MSFARLRRVLYLSWRDLRAHAVRSVLLTTMTSLGLLVFLVMTSLAGASGEQLDDAITQQFGLAGVYQIDLPTEIALPVDQYFELVQSMLEQRWSTAAIGTASFGDASTACEVDPTRENQQVVAVVSAINPERFRLSAPNASSDSACLLGMPVPTADTEVAAVISQMTPVTNTGPLVLPRTELPTAIAAFGRPTSLTIYALPDTDEVVDIEIRSLLSSTVEDAAARTGLDPELIEVTVSRLDADAASLRNAEQGVKTVYLVLGWAVLLLGAVGLLVAEMMNAQSRVWFFGLSRVWGASGFDLAVIACVEVLLLVLSALGLVVGFGLIVGPFIDAWSQSTFQAPLTLLQPSSVGPLVVGTLVLAAIGALYPAYRAATTDPLQALE